MCGNINVTMVTITGYVNPDIDCVACAIGYAELLNMQGKQARAVYAGDIGEETEFVKKYLGGLNIELVQNGYGDGDIILVDVSDPDGIDELIDINNVVEVIDHRKLAYIQGFPNAELHIDLVGSCATLIAERFQEANVLPSRHTAVLLYSAIVSNTVNFRNNVTTQRDRDMGEWLKEISMVESSYVASMFEYKSNINKGNLDEIMREEFKFYEIQGERVGVVQLELSDAVRRVRELEGDIRRVLSEIKGENNLDYLLLSVVDIIDGFNYFLTIDSASTELFSNVFNLSNMDKGVKYDGILMRKEIFPKVVEYFDFIDKVADALHEDWRKTKEEEDEESATHVTDTAFENLLEGWQVENRAAAKVVVGIINSMGTEIDLSNRETYNEIGEKIHQEWLKRNRWAADTELGKNFVELSKEEQEKDINQIRIALKVFGVG